MRIIWLDVSEYSRAKKKIAFELRLNPINSKLRTLNSNQLFGGGFKLGEVLVLTICVANRGEIPGGKGL